MSHLYQASHRHQQSHDRHDQAGYGGQKG
jgi:hypothetical protein